MNLPAPFYLWREQIAIDLPAGKAVFTTRHGGASEGPYESLNLGRLTDDRPGCVVRNRQLVQALVPGRLGYIRQVHGIHVRRLTSIPDAPSEDPSVQADFPEADGQATALRGVAPMVLVADCLPVVVATSAAVAMLHCGWRGLARGVIAEGVRAVRELGGDEPAVSAIGPGAGPCCYEVGEEVHAAFSELGPQVRDGRNLDLKGIARLQLERLGVRETYDVALCTICAETSPFFSHRRDGGVTGRQAGIAWLS
jgi:YfiH family protein